MSHPVSDQSAMPSFGSLRAASKNEDRSGAPSEGMTRSPAWFPLHLVLLTAGDSTVRIQSSFRKAISDTGAHSSP